MTNQRIHNPQDQATKFSWAPIFETDLFHHFASHRLSLSCITLAHILETIFGLLLPRKEGRGEGCRIACKTYYWNYLCRTVDAFRDRKPRITVQTNTTQFWNDVKIQCARPKPGKATTARPHEFETTINYCLQVPNDYKIEIGVTKTSETDVKLGCIVWYKLETTPASVFIFQKCPVLL